MRVDLVRCYVTERLDFHKVVFTDESWFTLDGNDSNKTWCKIGRPILNHRPYKGGSIMVWGAMTYTGRILLRKIEGSLNSEKYCDIMTKDVIPSLKSEMESFLLQQYNAPCHNVHKGTGYRNFKLAAS